MITGQGANPLLVLDTVSRTYEGPSAVRALLPTSLSVRAGDYVGIIGPSGSGKSTLLNLLGLLDRPTEGKYLIAGIDTAHLLEVPRTALRANMFGFVFQSYHLMNRRSLAENVELGMLYKEVDRPSRRSRATEALERVGLGHRGETIPANLSGGERQRLAIARALAAGPRVLLCDEPTGNLDSASSQRLLDLLESLNADGLTVVVITHDPEIGQRTRRLIEIRDGVVVEKR